MYTTAASQVVSNTMEEDDLNVSNSTVNHKSATLSPSQLYELYADNFNFYAIGIVIPFGLIGNIFSICIFLLSPILRRTTTGHYLVALAVADTTVLVGETLRWLTTYNYTMRQFYLPTSWGLDISNTSNVACRITYFLRYGGGLWSVWLTIAIAMERMIAVALPLKISHISTLLRSRVIIVIIAIISFGLALFVFWHVGINLVPQCKVAWAVYTRYHTWNNVIVTYGTLIIPGVVIAIITVIIIVLLYRARSKRMSQLATTSAHGGERKHWSNSGLSMETQLTIMLVTVCIATTALRAPYTIAYYVYSLCDGSCGTHAIVAVVVTEVFNIINYAINFILYCLSGSSFREQIRRTICRGKKTGSNYNTQQISLETSPTPQLGSSIRLLKTTTPGASPSAQTNDI